jgi:hypothetical protein
MLMRHRFETRSPLRGQSEHRHPPVALDGLALQEPLTFELIGEPGDAPPSHHQSPRKLFHPQAFGKSVQLGKQIKARQIRRKVLPQSLAEMSLDQVRAREQSKPEAKRQMLVVSGSALAAERYGL